MKRWMWGVVAFLGVQMVVHAENDVSNDPPLVCRKDDPFVFCTQGCSKQYDNVYAWELKNGRTKKINVEQDYCPWPTPVDFTSGNYYCRGWGMTGFTAWFQYDRVCPDRHHHGGKASDWVRENGQGNPEDEPFSH